MASCALAPSRHAHALGRTPVGGHLRVVLPWPLSSIDPHDLGDPGAALFGHALFDPLFALDASGEPYPTLAAAAPAEERGHTVLRLREGLLSARGAPLTARDALFSLMRARAAGASAWWGTLPLPALDPRDPLALVFAACDSARLARTLTSPLFALVPRAFHPAEPDGTGALSAELTPGRMVLTRNLNAARGASFLDAITIDRAVDLADSLRAFEGNLSEIGWLGAGLHAPRPSAVLFDCGAAAFITMHTGKEAGPWHAPGTAQRLADGLAPERLQQFALGPPLTGAATGVGWGAKPCELLLQEGSPYLEALASTIASLITRPGHEVTPKPLPAAELARRRRSSAYSLMLGVVRPFDASALGALTALTAAENPSAALVAMQHPPRGDLDPRVITRTLRIGVLGDLRVMGAHVPALRLARGPGRGGWDLASSFMASV